MCQEEEHAISQIGVAEDIVFLSRLVTQEIAVNPCGDVSQLTVEMTQNCSHYSAL